nr:metalloregulator ArsR/SmtB family transcription factor [Brevibacterium luteolum]
MTDVPTNVRDDLTISRTAELFKALATPSRLRILLVLSHGPTTVSSVVEQTALSQPLVSQHLKLLRGLHLVSVNRVGREAIYSLKDDHVAHIIVDAMTHATEQHF